MPEYNGEGPDPPFVKDNALFYTLGNKWISYKTKEYDFEYLFYDEKIAPLVNVDSYLDINKNFLLSNLGNFNFFIKPLDIFYDKKRKYFKNYF